MQKLLTIPGADLSDPLYSQIDAAEAREFGLHLPPKVELHDRLYFLLVEAETENLLACGYLKPIQPVLFGPDTFSFLNIGGVIANEKGKGHGKAVMTAMREYLLAHDKTGLGFCFPNNKVFYEKCGFQVDPETTPRFIYRDGDRCYTAEGQCVLYLESSDGFMQKVLAKPEWDVFVPDPGIW